MGVKISNEELQQFYNNGITDDDIQNTVDHYRNEGLSDEQIRAKVDIKLNSFKSHNTAGNTSDIGGEPLIPRNGVITGGIKFDWNNAKENIKTNPEKTIKQILAETQKKSPFLEFSKGIIQGLSTPLIGITKKFTTKDKAYGFLDNKPETFAGKTGKFVGEVAPAFLLPEVKAFQGANTLAKVGNTGLTGLYQGSLLGGLESLKNEGDLSGLGLGALAGGTLGAALPAIGAIGTKAVPWFAERAGSAFGGLSPKTLKQVIKPSSNALDLTEDKAENLLMNTTERIRNNYNSLLAQKGQAVNDAVENLRGNEYRIPIQDLQQDISQTFEQYGGDLINPARNMTGKLENDLNELITSGAVETKPAGFVGATDITEPTISPIDLEKAKQQIGNMINWSDETAKNYKNPILEQIYGKYNNRLSQLSPELQLANQEFANLRNFKQNEGLRRILRNGDNIDNASQALKNYNSTITKGNAGRNIKDLENVLVNEGYSPFLNDIDDVNAAADLLYSKPNGRNFMGATDLAKLLLIKPTLRGVRNLNRTGMPALLERTGETLSPYTIRLLMGTSYGLMD